jgi:hypothetical protein
MQALQSIQNAISKMVRHSNQTLLDWLQSFVAPVNKFLKATGQDNLGVDNAKTIWKDHFVNQITLSEKSLMMLYKREHLVQNELTSIKKLTTGEFNEKTLQKLVTKPYKPDKAILQYLNNHARQLGLEPPSFTNPKDKDDKSNRSEKQQSSSSEKNHAF